ncbi:OmpA family protein [Aestuariibius sp. 2305UL40-4]|uniref:OmpA family protein n=1 Tax=Aestuariibius violaceus TaxID=3234132 RepID=UPI00345EAEB8
MKYLFASVALLAVSACSEQAGSQLDLGTFGNATMNNHLVMTGQRDYAVALSRKFAAEVPTMVNFAFDSTVLDAEAQAILRQQADFIRQFPELRFKVFGHTDLVGSNAYNQRLGLRRAQAVVAFLTSQGVSRSRLEAVVSRGETQPLVVTEGREMRNRRTVTEVSGFVRNHPAVLNGKYAEVIFREYVESATRPPQLTTIGQDIGEIAVGG